MRACRARLSPVRVNFHCHHLCTCLSVLSLARVPASLILNACLVHSLANFALLAISSSRYWPPLPRGRSVCIPSFLDLSAHVSLSLSILSLSSFCPVLLSHLCLSRFKYAFSLLVCPSFSACFQAYWHLGLYLCFLPRFLMAVRIHGVVVQTSTPPHAGSSLPG